MQQRKARSHSTRVFFERTPDTHKQPLALAGERLQQMNRVFIGAVLRPHHRVDAQLREIGLSAQKFLYFLELVLS